ncbi:hypothetical protein [Legionella tunisiensis]|uniref:hypothetical protein n=1 Tax=Legionella tunisiensis TaxID=1034944 RepID=UPI0012EA2793|nr:hypothetical protein [Legionella tunisiensis]
MKQTLLILLISFALGSATYATTTNNSGSNSTKSNAPKTGISHQRGNMPTTPGIVNPIPGTTVPNPQLTPGGHTSPGINSTTKH